MKDKAAPLAPRPDAKTDDVVTVHEEGRLTPEEFVGDCLARLKDCTGQITRSRQDFENASAALQRTYESLHSDLCDIQQELHWVAEDIAKTAENTAAKHDMVADWLGAGDMEADAAVDTVDAFFTRDDLITSMQKHVRVILKLAHKLQIRANADQKAANEAVVTAQAAVDNAAKANADAADAATATLRESAQTKEKKDARARENATWWENVGKLLAGGAGGACVGGAVGAGVGGAIGAVLGSLAAWLLWCQPTTPSGGFNPQPFHAGAAIHVAPASIDQALLDELARGNDHQAYTLERRTDVESLVYSANDADERVATILSSVGELPGNCKIALRCTDAAVAKKHIGNQLRQSATALRALATEVRTPAQ